MELGTGVLTAQLEGDRGAGARGRQTSYHATLFHPEMNLVIEPNIELGEGTDREPFL